MSKKIFPIKIILAFNLFVIIVSVIWIGGIFVGNSGVGVPQILFLLFAYLAYSLVPLAFWILLYAFVREKEKRRELTSASHLFSGILLSVVTLTFFPPIFAWLLINVIGPLLL